MLADDSASIVIDVRTDAEWAYVGVTDLSQLSKEQINIAWVTFPGNVKNENFVAEVKAACPDAETTILFLCRSGVRSAGAAKAMTEAGYKNCYNVAEGFEGDKDDAAHRGSKNGWKVRGLAWKQG
ncbi:MAG: rhodanese-like domain-containing protein [Rhodospirillales bacterium]|nr:rhodanese-like domain-containing protein [Rhodospirillales bacterium]